MYCPNCGGKIINGKCKDCKKEITKELLALSPTEEMNIKDRNASLAAYIFWPLITFFKYEDKKLVGFHKNQGFTLFIVEILTVASFFIPTIGKFVGIVLVIFDLFLIYKGILNALRGDKNKLPIIGDYIFLKN
jgi:uncharacterized membrane protein